jgi:hypothetical protein
VTPFVVLGLPRSRTAWLSRFLAYGGRTVGHDLAVECGGLDDFLARLAGRAGTVETGMAQAWPLLLERGLRLVVVRRSVADVEASLRRWGVNGVTPELEARAAALDDLSGLVGVTTIMYPALADASVCAGLFQDLLGLPFDPGWWSALDGVNIQVDLPAQLERVRANAAAIALFKAEVLASLNPVSPHDGVVIGLEPFGSIWPECVKLGLEHFAEVGDTDSRRPLDLDRGLLGAASAAGSLRIVTARRGGCLLGYLFWSVGPDPESRGLLQADQGAWYVAPGAPRSTAIRMYERSIAELRRLGVRLVYPHHRLAGRGAGLGKFFARRGAVPEKQVYSLWIGD